MINENVIAQAENFSTAFQSARPFPHVLIDNFLTPSVAENCLADFPVFDPAKAINELGEIGGKAVNTKLADISPFYKSLYDYLFTDNFLTAMTRLTGISDLIGDPTLYGGGTHENRHNQELDPHIDFNYLIGGGAHRRLNLLIYLNKDWNSSWGGDLEIHSNPRDPDTNVISSYNTGFNRAIIFETSEHSWHGFPRINLPEHLRQSHSRKCLSIYLYSKKRPVEEMAGSHGTFYVQRPLPDRIRAGHVLTSADVEMLRQGYRARDEYIALYQREEERRGRAEVGLDSALPNARPLPLKIIGHVERVGAGDGEAWIDGWVGKTFEIKIKATSGISKLRIKGHIPKSAPRGKRRIIIAVGSQEKIFIIRKRGNFRFDMNVSLQLNEISILKSDCSLSYIPRQIGINDDERSLAYNLHYAEFV